MTKAQIKATLPHFKYHPDPIATKAFKIAKKAKICECCGKETFVYHETMYAVEDVECICPNCIKDGSAAAKFDGEFVQDADGEVSDQAKRHELFCCTPGYISWQGELWLTCCDDYCEFLGGVGTAELEKMGIADEVFAEYDAKGEYQGAREFLADGGDMAGYLFRCLHCGKYHLGVDAG